MTKVYNDYILFLAMDAYKIIQDCSGFEWDQYNIEKNRDKHKVTPLETEQTFFNKPLLIADDPKHSPHEKRFYALVKTDQERKLLIVFTIRRKKIRIVSSRDMNKKERNVSESC